jgi:hypothetical protein
MHALKITFEGPDQIAHAWAAEKGRFKTRGCVTTRRNS